MKSLLLFSHYNKHDKLSEHVVFLLESLQDRFEKIVIISNSALSKSDLRRLEGLSAKVVLRPNTGYDFAAWRDGMKYIGWKKMVDYDSVTIMNDTCFGPVFSLDPVFDSMEQKDDADFWGLITHPKLSASESHTGMTIHEHIQSFFITFNKHVVRSVEFKSFWNRVVDFEDVQEVINNYETKLTHVLSKAGFKYRTYVDAENNKGPIKNLTIYAPEKCLEMGLPLVKVKAFTHHTYPKYLLQKLGSVTDYPMEIIENYFNEYVDPNQQLLMFDKTVKELNKKSTDSQMIAVHLHAFYMDVAEEFITRFAKWSFAFDLYVTVSSDELKSEVSEILKKHEITPKEIMVLPNRGYAVIPWMTTANKYLNEYDVVGHFHTKKDAHMDEWVGKVWTGDLMDMLVDSADDIVGNFALNSRLGIVIPEIPTHARYLGAEMYYDVGELRDIVTALYIRMDIDTKRFVDMDKIVAYIYPYGMMYWYRPGALKPITDLGFTEQEVPYGKLPDTTVLHAVERLFVYVAWSRGFDYRIAKPSTYTSEFITTLSVNKQVFLREHNRPLNTVSLKRSIKIKIKKGLKKIASRLPSYLRVRALRSFIALKSRRASKSKRTPNIKLFTHELSNTGGPRVAIDLLDQIRKDKDIKATYAPELYIPAGANQDKDFYNEITDKGIAVNDFSIDSLFFNKDDVVIMNTIAYTTDVFSIILDNLERGTIKHLYLYPHEYVVKNYLSSGVARKISKLMKQGKLTVYTSSIQTQQVYQDFLNEKNKVKLMPNRIDIDESTLFARKKDDFNEVRFVVTGTPDARKGELDILYAFTSFYFNYFKGNENKYRDFSLSIVGLTNNFRDVYNKLYSDRLRVAAKALGSRVTLHGHVTEEKSLEIIKQCNLTILYSLYECLPRVVFDGLAYGHPVLRNDCSGYEEQLIDGVNGWKTSTEDWQGLVEAIEEALSLEKTSNSKLASMSRESVKIAKKYAAVKYRVVEDIKQLVASDS